ncbi:hypothetical protein JAAARDRAFT_61904 [Jaapia argillacea MUCL 33604]|uniref:F-box domain-containing protein n=1 Tax=Jaapia argillacea MUCL 33604 TaxID=933084 RepID=A0A067PCX7_9AGAM|nr:hypothetical protein JAAARDRAFT_61904 [Jaapia argillacea MUCL 33604]
MIQSPVQQLFTRRLQSSELDRLNSYTRRVRHLTYDHDRDFPYRTVIAELASYSEPRILLPRLSSLVYRYDFHSLVPHMVENLDTLLIICPTIQKLTIEGYARLPWSSRENRDQEYFDALPERFPHIQELVMNTDLTVPRLQFAEEFHRLRSLEIGVAEGVDEVSHQLHPSSLQALASMRNLESLSIGAYEVFAWESAPCLPGFRHCDAYASPTGITQGYSLSSPK